MSALEQLSVIIPVRPGDEMWKSLLHDLAMLPSSAEIFIVSPDLSPELHREFEGQLHAKLRFISSVLGRGHQMNAGANASSGEHLLFLHADSRLPKTSFDALAIVLESVSSPALTYFDLRFVEDGPPLMPLNECGARLRSNLFGIPFGDQGFCIRRDLFWQVGAYQTDLAYGEDHMFVWKCRALGIKTRRVPAPIFTSARKYRDHGWFLTTTKHISMTFRQILVARSIRPKSAGEVRNA